MSQHKLGPPECQGAIRQAYSGQLGQLLESTILEEQHQQYRVGAVANADLAGCKEITPVKPKANR